MLIEILLSLNVAFASTDSCDRELRTSEEVLNDLGDLLAVVEFPPVYADPHHPVMGTFETPGSAEAGLALHERRTAEDFATYVHARHGHKFVFINRFERAPVPLFDGVVMDGDHAAYNVSLKFASRRVDVMHPDSLITSLASRLDHSRELKITRDPIGWLRSVSGWQGASEGPHVTFHYDRDLKRGAKLLHIFGLNNFGGFLYGRELVTVLDMRESGYSFEFVNQRRVRRRIEGLVRTRGGGAESLILLWRADQVLEFGRD